MADDEEPIGKVPKPRDWPYPEERLGAMNPRALTEEKILRAITEALQRVYDETGIKVDELHIEWRERDPNGNRLTKTMVGKIDMKSTKTYRGGA